MQLVNEINATFDAASCIALLCKCEAKIQIMGLLTTDYTLQQ